MANEGKEGGVRIERDANGRSDIQPAQQGEYDGGRQVSEPSPADLARAGGSSGTGGYGEAENQQHHQHVGQSGLTASGDLGQSRGEKFDEVQGGGRKPVAAGDGTEMRDDEEQHQDRGQSSVE